MSTPAKNVVTPANPAKVRKARKPASGKRLAAEAALKNAKSDQEKAVARSHVKAVRFEELGRARARRAGKALDSLLNLANRSVYSWTDAQANQLLNHLTEKMKTVINKFAGVATTKEEFDFK